MNIILKIFILAIFACVSASKITKRGMMTGGLKEMEKPYPEYIKEYANFAFLNVSKAVNSPYRHKMIDIANVTKQVVQGMMYKMTITMAPTECKKNDKTELSKCHLLDCHPPTSCIVKVWSRPWLKEEAEKLQLSKYECKSGGKTC